MLGSKSPVAQRYSIWTSIQALVVQKVDNAIHQISRYLMYTVVCFVNTYPLNSNLSSGQGYPAFEQLGPEGVRLGS